MYIIFTYIFRIYTYRSYKQNDFNAYAYTTMVIEKQDRSLVTDMFVHFYFPAFHAQERHAANPTTDSSCRTGGARRGQHG